MSSLGAFAVTGLALVDFHNYIKRASGLRDGRAEVEDAAERILDGVASTFATLGVVREVDIRLYGGWIDEAGNQSPDAAVLVPLLPYLRGRRLGIVVRPSLATSLRRYPDFTLRGTVRFRARRRRQKMVDQMLGCDAAILARDAGEGEIVAIFSDDDDLVPPLLVAHANNPSTVRWIRRDTLLDRPNDRHLIMLGLRIIGGYSDA